MTDIIAIIGALIALAAAVFAYIQALAAKRSLRQAQLLKLFGSFDVASESTIANPELLYSVHGLSRDVPIEEARNIAYLSMLLDSFQHFYYEKYDGDFNKMVKEMKRDLLLFLGWLRSLRRACHSEVRDLHKDLVQIGANK